MVSTTASPEHVDIATCTSNPALVIVYRFEPDAVDSHDLSGFDPAAASEASFAAGWADEPDWS